MAKPFITANQVTMTRLALLPLGSWLLYQGPQGRLYALLFMTVAGCTDFVDGWLARRYGPTVLGGLMDPIADKVFILACFLPFVDLGFLQAWLVALLLLREFLVTALRSLYESRGVTLRTTFLAKVKTWVQMVGIGMIFVMSITGRSLMIGLFLVGVVLPLILAAVRYHLRRYVWRGALVFSAWYAAIMVIYIFAGAKVASEVLMISALAVTWLSGWVYLSQSRRLFEVRPLSAGDWIRVVGAVALPLVLVSSQKFLTPPSLALIITMSLEMAVGGLDNLLAHHHAEASALFWGLRVALVTVLYGLAILASIPGSVLAEHGLTPTPLTVAACAASLIGTVIEFVRGRNYYLDEALLSKPLL
jgi:CDP-diacylglycerol--glycerol-3-phosphate 3-phosphatidyltransferase